MEIIRIPRIAQETCRKHLLKGRSIGFVPTMGALHEGHMSLVRRAKTENDITVVSIFVNPIQFGPAEDLHEYPRNTEEDIKKLREAEVDTAFVPDSSLMYPPHFSTCVEVEGTSRRLCGGQRPGHFRGVSTVVAKLLNIANPARVYFGQKDFQQTVIIGRMVKDLNFDVEVVVCPTVREHDGLAMSSRNLYLDDERRKAAAVLYRSLTAASDSINAGQRSAKEIRGLMERILSGEPLVTQIDYASLYDPATLEETDEVKDEVLLAVAARLGEVRLIDNVIVNVS
ncbi:MAG: pantoate--beta-alanine ligase [Candidatus Sulfobium sp.]|jgi:pantoate--beta-alanine ligase